MSSLSDFHPIISRWFLETLGEPTLAQSLGWGSIRERRHTLIAAPTGSGKTLAAFLTALDDLVKEGSSTPLPDEVRVIYISPLKALSADIHKNLAVPRRGIQHFAAELGFEAPRITAAVRTGDTTQSERASMLRTPPHILVTTPESLYLLLTAERSREMLRTVRTVIVDEIHAVIGTRRGAHLALSLERLQQIAQAPLVRLGLSATQKPIEEVARFLVGGAVRDSAAPGVDCAIVNEGHRRQMRLELEMPDSPLEAVMSNDVWEEYFAKLTALIEAHKTTLVFVNTRRLAERIARHLSERLGDEAVTAHHGSLSKERRLDAETRLKEGRLKALVATASLELGIDIGAVDLVCQIGSPHRIATLLQRVGRSGHAVSALPSGRLFPMSRDDLIECAALLRSVEHGELDTIVSHDAPLDVLAQQIVAETSCCEYRDDELFDLVRRAWPYRSLARSDFDKVVAMTAEGFSTKRGRRGALLHRDEVQGRLRGRRGSRLLAISSGGAIPEVADYRVVLDPEDTFIGTINEDFAIESMAGDIFQLGNASWQILRVGAGVVRVADAKGAPPTLPFWLGEAPARSDELSRAVSDLRAGVDHALDEGNALEWFVTETGTSRAVAEQAVAYLGAGRNALGSLPTQERLVAERFFDESGGMQLVIHSPFGSRVNKAWGLALRKRFCRQFNFELQAAATEDALLLSLGPQHSFPLSDVFRYLHPATVREVLIQAFLDAPVFQTRWRWNATISLAVPRNRAGRKVAPQLQRMLADDLLAAAFPDAAACLENIPGDRQIPDHPLVSQTVRDCLEEAMDIDSLVHLLEKIHRGDIQCLARDTAEPSALSHEILNAKPYAFLDDAPLEERRTQAVLTRRASDVASASDLGALDESAIARVCDEERPDPRDPDELHDVLMSVGFLTEDDRRSIAPDLFERLAEVGRATGVVICHGSQGSRGGIWVAAERLPEILAVHPDATIEPVIAPPASRASRAWTRDSALVELVRGRMSITGPLNARVLAEALSIDRVEVDAALIALESEGAILRGRFTRSTVGDGELEWCDRRLLSRIHRYTLNRLRAEIEPVSPADFMRFLFSWQHVEPSSRLNGPEGLRSVLESLDGYEAPADAWERAMLPARIDGYEPPMLDMLSLTGEVGWARFSTAPVKLAGATPIALFLREHGEAWQLLCRDRASDPGSTAREISEIAQRLLTTLRERGASFTNDLATRCGIETASLVRGIEELVAAGLITSDGIGGLRSLVRASADRPAAGGRVVNNVAGRWSMLQPADGNRDAAAQTQAETLLRRYGIVFRRILTREANAAPWRELTRIYRRLEARGEIRGGRFVAGMTGEQFALPNALERLREVRRTSPDNRCEVISAADPLNLAGIVTSGDRVRAITANRVVYRNGVPLAAMEGDFVRPLAEIETGLESEVASKLAGRAVPAVVNGYLGRRSDFRYGSVRSGEDTPLSGLTRLLGRN